MSTQGRPSRSPWGLSAVVVAIVLLGVVWVAFPHEWAPSIMPSVSPSTPGAPAEPDAASVADGAITAREVLDTLEVKGRAPRTGYDRVEQFGTVWFEADRNGCDTRNDILARDLTGVELAGLCRVLAGTLDDPFTGTTIDFVRGQGTSTAVQIDHVVALLDAWQKGAQQLSLEQRVAFANDPINLIAVDGPQNSAKGAGDAATWLPPNRAFRCEYVARQVSVKAADDLWVTAAEHEAIARILDGCPVEPALRSELAG